MKITLVRIEKRTKEHYGMYAADWYVVGYDAEGKRYEGWESDFIIRPWNLKDV